MLRTSQQQYGVKQPLLTVLTEGIFYFFPSHSESCLGISERQCHFICLKMCSGNLYFLLIISGTLTHLETKGWLLSNQQESEIIKKVIIKVNQQLEGKREDNEKHVFDRLTCHLYMERSFFFSFKLCSGELKNITVYQ